MLKSKTLGHKSHKNKSSNSFTHFRGSHNNVMPDTTGWNEELGAKRRERQWDNDLSSDPTPAQPRKNSSWWPTKARRTQAGQPEQRLPLWNDPLSNFNWLTRWLDELTRNSLALKESFHHQHAYSEGSYKSKAINAREQMLMSALVLWYVVKKARQEGAMAGLFRSTCWNYKWHLLLRH